MTQNVQTRHLTNNLQKLEQKKDVALWIFLDMH